MWRWNNLFITILSLRLLLGSSFIFVWNVLGPSNKGITCSQTTLDCWSWLLFNAEPSLGCDNRNPGLSCWTSRLLSSGPSWVPSSSQERPLKGCLHNWDCVHSLQCFSFQRILFPSFHRVLACEGRQIGVWAVTRLLFLRSQKKSRLHSAEAAGRATEGWTQSGKRDAKFNL